MSFSLDAPVQIDHGTISEETVNRSAKPPISLLPSIGGPVPVHCALLNHPDGLNKSYEREFDRSDRRAV